MGIIGGKKKRSKLAKVKPLVELARNDWFYTCNYHELDGVDFQLRKAKVTCTQSSAICDPAHSDAVGFAFIEYQFDDPKKEVSRGSHITLRKSVSPNQTGYIFDRRTQKVYYGSEISDFPDDIHVTLFVTTDIYLMYDIIDKFR